MIQIPLKKIIKIVAVFDPVFEEMCCTFVSNPSLGRPTEFAAWSTSWWRYASSPASPSWQPATSCMRFRSITPARRGCSTYRASANLSTGPSTSSTIWYERHDSICLTPSPLDHFLGGKEITKGLFHFGILKTSLLKKVPCHWAYEIIYSLHF